MTFRIARFDRPLADAPEDLAAVRAPVAAAQLERDGLDALALPQPYVPDPLAPPSTSNAGVEPNPTPLLETLATRFEPQVDEATPDAEVVYGELRVGAGIGPGRRFDLLVLDDGRCGRLVLTRAVDGRSRRGWSRVSTS